MFHKVFPTLIAEFDLSKEVDNDTIVKKFEISGLQMHGVLDKGMSSYLGGYDCALTRLAMKDLQSEIQACIDKYCQEAGLQRNLIVNSWCNILKEGGRVKRHRHEKSILSGAYYPKSDPDDCPLLLENPNHVFKMTETKVSDTEYNVEQIGIPTKTGKLVIWPSYLYHETFRNSSDERYTLSFNTLDESYINSLDKFRK
jgi:uncharacterized protein (TIGR02466 family)